MGAGFAVTASLSNPDQPAQVQPVGQDPGIMPIVTEASLMEGQRVNEKPDT